MWQVETQENRLFLTQKTARQTNIARTKHKESDVAVPCYQPSEYNYLLKTGEEMQVFILWLVIMDWLQEADWRGEQV